MDNKLSSSFIREEEEYGQLLEAVGSCLRTKPMPILVGGLCEGAVESFLVSLLDDLPAAAAAPSLILCPNGKSCRIIRDRLSACGISAEVFPPRDLNLYNITASHDFEHERLQVLTGILKGTLSVVVSTPDAALSYTIPPAVLKDATLVINKSDSLDLPAVSRALVDAGYIRCDLVDGIGQFSVRGGIIDIYPP